MKKNVVGLLLLMSAVPLIGGCAAGSATAGYSLKATTADELSPNARHSIIDEAVDKSYSKTKEYVDSNFQKKQ